jgi:hypothetical protein
MVLVYHIKPTLISQIYLYDPQQLLIGIYNILSRNGGSNSLEEINVKNRIQRHTFKPYFPQYWDLYSSSYCPL